MPKIVYVASPIDHASEEEKPGIDTQVALVQEALARAGYSVFVPAFAWHSGEQPGDAIHQVNMAALEEAAGLVVVGATRAHSIGVYIEAGYMHGRGRPVVFFRKKPASLTLSDFPVIEHPENLAYFFDTFKGARAAIGYWEEKPGQYDPPRRAYPGDAGFDLATAEDFLVTPTKNGDPAHRIPLAHRLFPPEGFWFLLAERSSTRDRWGVEVIPGVMDNGYTGPWFARVVLRREEPVLIPAGTRLVQAIPVPVALADAPVVGVPEIPATKRGQAGFGSSDAKEVE